MPRRLRQRWRPTLQPERLETIQARTQALYQIDDHTTIRKSHENPSIIRLYEEYLGEPGGHRAHELLHTEYWY